MARILQVCNTDFYLGKFLSSLVLELTARGHVVECACQGKNSASRLAAAGVAMYDFRFPRQGSPLGFVGAIRRMRELIRRGRYDCVDSHNRNASMVARVAAWLEGVPVNLYTAHGFYFHDGQSAVARQLTIQLEAILARITSYTLSQSAEDLAFTVGRGLVPRERIAYIGNGIDVDSFSPRFKRATMEERLGLKRGVFRIGTTGRIVKGKGFEDLLRAYASFAEKVPDSQLLLIGGNIAQDIQPFQREIAAETNALGLGSRVQVTGMVGNVEEYLSTVDLFVLPSYREGMPRSLIEAMAMGLCCIATDIRGCREIVTDGVTGFLYPVGDIATLSALMLRCYGSPEERAQMSGKARAAAVKDFSESEYVRRQVLAIVKLLREKGRA